jgi:hypothetical protein
MRVRVYDAIELQRLLKRKKVCTLEELMEALGTTVRMTVFRKLAELSYLTSYSHRGRYYTLKPLCQFDDNGLWSYREAWFSRDGTLLETAKRFIDQSEAGYGVAELDEALHVDTQQALLQLYKKSWVHREKFEGIYIYLSAQERERKHQFTARQGMGLVVTGKTKQGVPAHELKAAIVLFFSLLDEQQRRLYAGLESMKIGRGGDARIATVLGIDPHTVARGRVELRGRDIDVERVRKRGGGRPSAEKKHPR